MYKSCVDKILCGERTIIGIRNFVTCDNPESRLWINDYPGLSFKDASRVANDEMQTGNEVLKKSIEQGIKHTYDDFMDFLGTKFKFNVIAETRELNNFSSEITPKANLERGLSLRRWRSEMAKIFVEEVYIKSSESSTVDVLLIDGDEIHKIENVVIEPNKTITVRFAILCKSENVKVLFNQKDNDVYKCNFTSINGWHYAKRCCGQSNNNGFVVTGWDGNKETDNCFGMGVLAYVKCYEDDVFCALIPRLYMAFYYRSVVEYLKYRIYTNRVNNLTTFGVEQAKEMLGEAEALYQDKYGRVINNSDTFFRSLKGDCLTCNTMSYVQSTP